MAIYHCSVKNGSRTKGQSAVAAAAYRSGTMLTDKEVGLVSDYTHKGGIVYSEVALCNNAPSEYADRETLWNAVHEVEKAKNARLWREIEVAIPREFSAAEQIEAVRQYVQGFVAQGMCADWSIHDKQDGNPHAHIMLTTRPIKENGEWGSKEKKDYARDENGEKIPVIDPQTGEQKVDKRNRKQWQRVTVQANNWNDRERIEEWRAAWADVCNQSLKPEQRIDHRSYERQGVDKIPTIHEGYAARAIKARGEHSDRCDTNRVIVSVWNSIQSDMNALEQQIEAMQRIKERENVSNGLERWATIEQMKAQSKLLNLTTSEAFSSADGQSSCADPQDIDEEIAQIEKAIKAIQIYRKYKPIADEAEKALFRKKYENKNADALKKFGQAKAVLKKSYPDGKVPSIEQLQRQREELLKEKDAPQQPKQQRGYFSREILKSTQKHLQEQQRQQPEKHKKRKETSLE